MPRVPQTSIAALTTNMEKFLSNEEIGLAFECHFEILKISKQQKINNLRKQLQQMIPLAKKAKILRRISSEIQALDALRLSRYDLENEFFENHPAKEIS